MHLNISELKMAVKILPVLVIFFTFVLNAETTLSIDWNPEELQSIGEVLVESYLHHNLIQRRPTVLRTIWGLIIKFSLGITQMICMTVSLIAANIFTPFFQTTSQAKNIGFNSFAQMHQNYSNFSPSQKCQHDFGCDQNICWRSCGNDVKTRKSWCYTAPNANSRKITHCNNPHDCSPCWNCIGVCHMPKV